MSVIYQSATVEFGRTVRPADFESIPVKVTVGGLIAGPEDLLAMGDQAYVECMRLLTRELERRNGAVAPQQVVVPPAPAKAVKQPIVIGEPKQDAGTPAPAPIVAPVTAPGSNEDYSEMSDEDLGQAVAAKAAELRERGAAPTMLRKILLSHLEPKNFSQVWELKGADRHAFVAEIKAA